MPENSPKLAIAYVLLNKENLNNFLKSDNYLHKNLHPWDSLQMFQIPKVFIQYLKLKTVNFKLDKIPLIFNQFNFSELFIKIHSMFTL